LICIHNLNWEDWYNLSKAWVHLFHSTPTFCEQHTNVSCIGKLLILYNSAMFYLPLFKTSSSRSSLLISFHVPKLPLILSLLCGPYIVTGHINLTTQLHCAWVTPTRDMIKSIIKELFSHYTWIYTSLDMTTKTSGLHSFQMLCSVRRKSAISQKQNLLLIHTFTKIPTMLANDNLNMEGGL
jgi:hypothetical protein